jgi:hypothetical protein
MTDSDSKTKAETLEACGVVWCGVGGRKDIKKIHSPFS